MSRLIDEIMGFAGPVYETTQTVVVFKQARPPELTEKQKTPFGKLAGETEEQAKTRHAKRMKEWFNNDQLQAGKITVFIHKDEDKVYLYMVGPKAPKIVRPLKGDDFYTKFCNRVKLKIKPADLVAYSTYLSMPGAEFYQSQNERICIRVPIAAHLYANLPLYEV